MTCLTSCLFSDDKAQQPEDFVHFLRERQRAHCLQLHHFTVKGGVLMWGFYRPGLSGSFSLKQTLGRSVTMLTFEGRQALFTSFCRISLVPTLGFQFAP